MHRRPYFFELFTIANFLVLDLVLRRVGFSAFQLLGSSFAIFAPGLAIQAAIGLGARWFLTRRRINTRDVTDIGRIVFFSVLWCHIYGWLKVAVPALNHRLYDQFFWNLDRALFFGLSPNVFFLELFSNPIALRAVDWSYANVFLSSIFIGGAFFLSHPDPDVRANFVNTNATVWVIGGWLYVALPAFDPCYRFPEIWLPMAKYLSETQYLQRLLMTNYQHFMQLQSGKPAEVSLLLGLSAWPSLHVAYSFLVYLWMRGISRIGKIVFGIFTIIIFVGSIVTGWHYLADSLAGLVLAALVYAAFRWLPARFRRHAETD